MDLFLSLRSYTPLLLLVNPHSYQTWPDHAKSARVYDRTEIVPFYPCEAFPGKKPTHRVHVLLSIFLV
jgi:hypothetical protein